MEFSLDVLIANTIVLGILFGSVTLWYKAIGQWRRTGVLLTYEPRSPVPWDGAALAAAIVGFLALPSVAIQLVLQNSGLTLIPDVPLVKQLPPSMYAWMTIAKSATDLVFAGLLCAMVLSIRGSVRDLGWNRWTVRTDLRLGFLGFVMMVVPVMSIQAALTHFFPSEHPVMELIQEGIKQHPEDTWLIVLAAVLSAGIVAPIVEEFSFRVLLQGWLEKLALRLRRNKIAPVLVENTEGSSPESESIAPTIAAIQAEKPPLWPLLVSSTVFALAHLGHGPDFVPLFFFALGLGYLYRQTHRILPGIVMHFCLNAMSLTVMIITAIVGSN